MTTREDLYRLVSELPEWALQDVARLLTAYSEPSPWTRLDSAENEDEPLSPAELEALQSWRATGGGSAPMIADSLTA
jgi:hypothetical protein